MNHNKRIVLAISLSTLLLALFFLEYYWQQISELAPPVGMMLLLLLMVVVLVKLVSSAIIILRNKHKVTFKVLLPLFIYLATLLLIYFNPKALNAYTYQRPVVYRGCYEGTMNTGVILFREAGKFEYKHVGFFGITTFATGKWRQMGDTLYIDYDEDNYEFVGEKLLMTEERFIKVEGDSVCSQRFGFYRGFCKGLN